jgi:hypothetical protein
MFINDLFNKKQLNESLRDGEYVTFKVFFDDGTSETLNFNGDDIDWDKVGARRNKKVVNVKRIGGIQSEPLAAPTKPHQFPDDSFARAQRAYDKQIPENVSKQVPWDAVVNAIVYDQFDTLMDRYGLTFDDIEYIVRQHGFNSSDDVRAEYGQSLEEEHEYRWQQGFNSYQESDSYWRDIAHEKGADPIAMFGKGDAERYRRFVMKYVKPQKGIEEGADERKENRLWTMIADYEKRAKATKNDIKRDHYMKMAKQLRDKLKTSDVEEGLKFHGGFPDVDHMRGAVHRDADMITDNVKTNNKKDWDRAVDSINARVFDDMSDFYSDSKGERVVGNSAVWAKWDNETQTGWFNAKGRPLKPWPVKEQGVAEAGPFSYGAKKPKKGSVADLAARKRKEQERDKQPSEPKDHMVGVARVVKEMDKSAPQPGRDGHVSHRTYGSRDTTGERGTQHTAKPQKAKDAAKDAEKILNKIKIKEGEDLSQYSTERLQAYVKKVSGGGVPAFGSGAKLKRVQAELKRRERGVAEGSLNEFGPDEFNGGDDLGNIYAVHPDPREGESVAIKITDVDEHEFDDLWAALPMPYLNEFGGDLPLWNAEDLKMYPNMKVQRMTFDQYVKLVGNYINSDDMASTALSKMKRGVTEGDTGISKDKETQFHAKLDKLVHNTFGKRRGEMEEGRNVLPAADYVSGSKKLLQYVKRNFQDLASWSAFYQDRNDVYVDKKLENLFKSSDGSNISVAFPWSGKVELKNNTLYIPMGFYWQYRGLFHGPQFIKEVIDALNSQSSQQNVEEGSVQDRLHKRHQELRKKSGLPDPDYYKELKATYDLPDEERYKKAAEVKKKYKVTNEDVEKYLDEMQRAGYEIVTESATLCPECGGPAYSDRMLAEKQDACYHKVKSRYKVWPSAYASGALVRCRKVGAANWGNKSKK